MLAPSEYSVVSGARNRDREGRVFVNEGMSTEFHTSSLRPGLLASVALPSAALAGGVGAYLRNRVQRAQVFVPTLYPHGFWDPGSHGLPVADEWFETEDGVKLHAWWIRSRRPRGTVLYCHGNNGNITHRIGVLEQLWHMRLNVFAFDYRGYGRSEGEPSEEGLYRDVRAALDHLSGNLGQQPDSILLFGHSLGGAVAIDGALNRPVAGLVVQSSFTHIRDMTRALFPRLPLHLVARNQFRSVDKVGRLEMPKLFIHGTDDPTVPHRLGRRLFDAAVEPKEWFEIPRAGHNDVFRTGGMRYLWRLQRFARRVFRG